MDEDMASSRPPPVVRMSYEERGGGGGGGGDTFVDTQLWLGSPPDCGCTSPTSSLEGFLSGVSGGGKGNCTRSATGFSSSSSASSGCLTSTSSGSCHQHHHLGSASTSTRAARQLSPFVGEGSVIHHVNKFDTLAGLAIKYGVEVADIKRCNALVSDVQMFARKVLRIPTPGPFSTPASILAAGDPGSSCESAFPGRDWGSSQSSRESFASSSSSSSSSSALREYNNEAKMGGRRGIAGSKGSSSRKGVSSAMGLLRGYYGLGKQRRAEGTEMAVYKSDENLSEDDDGLLSPMEGRTSRLTGEWREGSWASKSVRGIEKRESRWGKVENEGRGRDAEEISDVPERRSLEEGGGGFKTRGGNWGGDHLFARYGVEKVGSRAGSWGGEQIFTMDGRRNPSQSEEIAAIVESSVEQARMREKVRPAGAVGCVAGLDEAIQGGITEVVDEKLVRRKGVGNGKAALSTEAWDFVGRGAVGSSTGYGGGLSGGFIQRGRENGSTANEKGGRGLIPGRGPIPRTRSFSEDRLQREEGVSPSGLGVTGWRGETGVGLGAGPMQPVSLSAMNGWKESDFGRLGTGVGDAYGGGSGKGGVDAGGGGLSSLLSASAVEDFLSKVRRSASLSQINGEEGESGGLLSSIGRRRLSAGNLFGSWTNIGVDLAGAKPPHGSRRNKASVD